MSDDWRFFSCAMGEHPAFIFVNVALRESVAHAPTYLARIHLNYKRPRANGLPTNEEAEAVGDLEDELSRLAKEAGDVYAGRVTVDGKRYLYFYTGRGESEWARALEHVSQSTGYELNLSYRDDPEHLGYYEELCPTDDDWQVIEDPGACAALCEVGGDGSVQRGATSVRRVRRRKILRQAHSQRHAEGYQ